MKCTCTFAYNQIDQNTTVGIRIGDTCQSCLDAASLQEKISSNFDIKNKLDAIDAKSVRALREGDTQRIADLEAQAVVLRAQLQVI